MRIRSDLCWWGRTKYRYLHCEEIESRLLKFRIDRLEDLAVHAHTTMSEMRFGRIACYFPHASKAGGAERELSHECEVTGPYSCQPLARYSRSIRSQGGRTAQRTAHPTQRGGQLRHSRIASSISKRPSYEAMARWRLRFMNHGQQPATFSRNHLRWTDSVRDG